MNGVIAILALFLSVLSGFMAIDEHQRGHLDWMWLFILFCVADLGIFFAFVL